MNHNKIPDTIAVKSLQPRDRDKLLRKTNSDYAARQYVHIERISSRPLKLTAVILANMAIKPITRLFAFFRLILLMMELAEQKVASILQMQVGLIM